uniref:Uncharacterized protein n=1 Tax=Physcomitrium patens TaxID=3218 RepID=A0A2K1JXX0_PHYPA|nr:hypothetical protein PHYPA_013494 [Physcomitrium patens]
MIIFYYETRNTGQCERQDGTSAIVLRIAAYANSSSELQKIKITQITSEATTTPKKKRTTLTKYNQKTFTSTNTDNS